MFTRVRLRRGAAIAAGISHVTPAARAATAAPSFAPGKRGRIAPAPLPTAMALRLAELHRRGRRAA